MEFGTRPLVLYVNNDHEWSRRKSVRLKELHRKKMIIRETGSQTRQVFEKACAEAGITPMQRIEINNRDAFREAVAHGLGIGVMGDRGLVPDTRLHRISISDVVMSMVRHLACLKERQNSRLIRTFLAVGQSIAEREA